MGLMTAPEPDQAERKSAAGAQVVDPSDPPISLYASHQKIHPRSITGRFRNLKWLANALLLAAYFIGPWIPWPRDGGAPDQAILLDMAARRGYFFFIEIWPQEVYYLTGLLVLGAVGLFLATSLLGRVWCGFTCIQTVFTDVFVAVERAIEGDRNARIALDKGPWTRAKFGKKIAKNLVWLGISVLVSATWLFYFNEAGSSATALLTGEASTSLYGFLALFTLTTFTFAGYAREQICIYMCPWPRFQAAMTDEETYIVTYEAWRGEPRGPARKNQDFSGRGHCVDCGLCVAVCPTGVDIREGSQLACIGCGLCVDACNSVMAKFGLPGELITYDSTSNQVAREKGEPTRRRFVRPRTIGYLALLLVIGGFMALTLATRARTEINLLHERSPLFTQLSDGAVRNGYTLKILNMKRQDATFALRLDGLPQARLSLIGGASGVEGLDIPLAGDTVGTYRLYVTVPGAVLTGRSTPFSLVVENQATGEVLRQDALFAGPGR